MDSNLTLELTGNQLQLLQEGLRYVRSSRKLAFRETVDTAAPQREADLRQIAKLMAQLDAVPTPPSESARTAN